MEENIREKIAKLLNKTVANGCTESEAAQALAMAHKLLAKYNMTIEDLNVEDNEIVENIIDTDTQSVSAIQVHIACALQNHFGIELLRTRTGRFTALKVVGEKIKADIFRECFLFAYNSFKHNWSVFNKTLECTSAAKAAYRGDYLKGFTKGFVTELERQENQYALVVVKSAALTKYFGTKYSTSRSCHYNVNRSNDMGVYAAGYEAGTYAQRAKGKAIE